MTAPEHDHAGHQTAATSEILPVDKYPPGWGEPHEPSEAERLVQRIENAIGIVGLRVKPHGFDVMPQASSVDLVKMILLDGASLLSHFMEADDGS